MTKTQILILLAAVFVEVGQLISGLESWDAAQTTQFVGAAFVALGIQVAGVLSRGPEEIRLEKNREALAEYARKKDL
jgi:hypothetical protein